MPTKRNEIKDLSGPASSAPTQSFRRKRASRILTVIATLVLRSNPPQHFEFFTVILIHILISVIEQIDVLEHKT